MPRLGCDAAGFCVSLLQRADARCACDLTARLPGRWSWGDTMKVSHQGERALGRRLIRGAGGCAVALALAGLGAGVGAGSARAETLNQALAAAYKFNPRLDAARAIQRATDEEVPRALSGYRPVGHGHRPTPATRSRRRRAASASGNHARATRAATQVGAGAADLPRLPDQERGVARRRRRCARAGRRCARRRASVLLEARDGLHGRGARPGDRDACARTTSRC